MGLIRAVIITAIIYVVWQMVQNNSMYKKLDPSIQCKYGPWIPMGLLFIIELLI